MRTILLLAALVAALSSCSMIEAAKAASLKTAELAVELQGVAKAATTSLDEAKVTYVAAKAEADTDGDGKTSGSEWLMWLIGLGGVGGVGGASAVAKGMIRNAKSDGRKDAIEARLDAVERPKTA